MIGIIYKYTLVAYSRTEINTPVGSIILSCQAQRDQICIWVLSNMDELKTEKRSFITQGTGHKMDFGQMVYIGTVQLNGGYDVQHVFEVK